MSSLARTRGVIFWSLAVYRMFAAPTDCAPCHANLVRMQTASNHANTLKPYTGSRLQAYLSSGAERDGFHYDYGPSSVVVRRNSERASATLEWAFGAGAQGFTPVGRHEGLYFEHRLSYYTADGRIAATPGHYATAPRSAADALGILKLPQDIYECFNCHSTALKRDIDEGPDLSGMTPGVTCERCHGAGARHRSAAQSHSSLAEITGAIVNPGKLAAKAVVGFCGGCHRLPEPGRSSEAPERDNPVSVRFQPMGLMASRCFRESQSLSCLTCHDPHENAVKNPAFYSARCARCHAATATPIVACKRREGQNCLPCHMRKASPLPHLTFTDHRIRVY